MSEINISKIDDIFIEVKDSKDEASEEILSKLFGCITNYANLTNGSVFDKTLFNEKNSTNQKKVVAACLLRLLCNREELIWNNTALRLKTFIFLDSQMIEEYKILKIELSDENHIKLSKLRDIETNMYKDFESLTNSLNSINTLNNFRKSYMKLLRNPIYRLIKDVFIDKSLISEHSLNELFDATNEYNNSLVSEKLVLFKNVESLFRKYIANAEANLTNITQKCIVDPISKLLSLIINDFESHDAIKESSVEVRNLDRKYQFGIISNKLDLKFLLVNNGPGYAFDVTIEIIDVDNYFWINNHILSLGDIEPKGLQVVYEAKVSKIPEKKVSVILVLKWNSFNKKENYKEFIFELQSQRKDINWDEIKAIQPYSLEAVEDEEELVGRSEIIEKLYNKLTAKKIESAIIYGQKRVGKTSIAQTIHNKIMKDNKYISIFIKMGDLDKTSPVRLVQYLGEEILNETSYINGFNDIEKPQFDSSIAPIIRYFKNIKHKHPEFNFVIILDEFDEIPSEFYHYTNIGDTFFHNIRSLSSEGNIGFILVGGENMQIIMQSTDKLNKFNTFRVDYFDKSNSWKDFQELIRKPVKDFIEYNDNSIIRLYEMTEGNPFFTKLVCKNIFANMCESRNSYVCEDDVEVAILETIESLDVNHINHFWKDGIAEDESAQRDNIETQRRKMLIAFAESIKENAKDGVDINDLQQFDFLKSEVAIKDIFTSFVNREIFVEDGNKYRIKPNFIEKWLIERGSKLISSSFLDQNALNELKKRESDLYVSDKETVDLCNSWGLYRGIKITPIHVRAWLNQFKNNYEKRIMFKLLKHLNFYSEVVMREKLKVIHSSVKSKVTYEIIPGERHRYDILLSCFGSVSKSGATYARWYAQENEIISDNVMPASKIPEEVQKNKRIRAIVFIDDIIGSGDTFISNLKKINIEYGDLLFRSGVKVFICGVCGYEKGVDKIEKEARKVKFDIRVNVADMLYEDGQCFGTNSSIFESDKEKETAKEIAIEYGRKLSNKLPLGYDNSGLLVVFPDNCPDNTLGIIWDESIRFPRWQPLFKRI